MSLRRLGHGEIPINGRAADLDTLRNGGNPQVLRMQLVNLVVQVYPSFLASLTDRYEGGMLLWRAMGRRLRERSVEGIKISPIAEKEPLQSVAQIPHHVKSINDLHRLRRPTPNPFGIQPTPIAADDLDAGLRPQPLRNRCGRAIGEQIHHPMSFEITDNGAEASAPPPGPFIKANHPWRRQGGIRYAMDETQDCPTTPRKA